MLCTDDSSIKNYLARRSAVSGLRNTDTGPCRPVQGLWILLQVSREAIRGWEQRSDRVSATFLKSHSGCCVESRLERGWCRSTDPSGGFCGDLGRRWQSLELGRLDKCSKKASDSECTLQVDLGECPDFIKRNYYHLAFLLSHLYAKVIPAFVLALLLLPGMPFLFGQSPFIWISGCQ